MGPSPENGRLTRRLRLEPTVSASAAHLWTVQSDDAVWPWYSSRRPSRAEVQRQAEHMGDSWQHHGVHKWIAFHRATGEVVGRGGLSRTPIDDDWGQLYRFLPDEPWVRAAYEVDRPFVSHAWWLELGWALRREFWGFGYASEIGRAGLAFAFSILRAEAVVSCTTRHNVRSRAVMERIGMRYTGEILTRGVVDGASEERDDAPHTVHVLLREDWTPHPRLWTG